MVSDKVSHADVIATAKAIAVRVPLVAWSMRMTVLIAVIHVWAAVVVEILVRAFDSIVEPLALDLLHFLRWRIPSAVILSVGIVRGTLGHAGCFDSTQSCDAEEKGNCRYYKPIESHVVYLLCILWFLGVLLLRQR
jgi:hypothetical protein